MASGTDEQNDQTITQKSVVYTFLNDFDQAKEILNKQLEIKPDVKIYNLLGKVFMKAKEWSDACGIFEKSIQFIVSFEWICVWYSIVRVKTTRFLYIDPFW